MLGYAPLPHLERCRCCPRIIDPQQCPVGCKELRQHNPDLMLAQVRLSPIRSQSADYNIPAQIRDIVLTRLPWLTWKGRKHSQAPNIPYQHAIMFQRFFSSFLNLFFSQITPGPIHPPSYTLFVTLLKSVSATSALLDDQFCPQYHGLSSYGRGHCPDRLLCAYSAYYRLPLGSQLELWSTTGMVSPCAILPQYVPSVFHYEKTDI